MQSLLEKLQDSDLVSLPDWKVAEILNEPSLSMPLKRTSVDTRDAQEVLLASATGDWGKIVIACENTALPLEIRAAAITLRDTIRQSSVISTHVQEIYDTVAQSLSALVEFDLVSSSTRDTLLALAFSKQSWAEYNNTEVTPRIVGLARGGI